MGKRNGDRVAVRREHYYSFIYDFFNRDKTSIKRFDRENSITGVVVNIFICMYNIAVTTTYLYIII